MTLFELGKEQKQLYVKICERAWGCSPINVDWAIATLPFWNTAKKMFADGEITKFPDYKTNYAICNKI